MRYSCRTQNHCVHTTFFLFLFLTAQLYAGTSGSLVGTVKDKATKKGVPGVQLKIEGTTRGGVTKPDGRFSIANIPAGTYTVTIRSVAHETKKAEVSIQPDKQTQLDVVLEEKAISTQQITIEAKRMVHDAPKTADEVGIARIEPAEKIQHSAGVRVQATQVAEQRTGVVATGGGISIRGTANAATPQVAARMAGVAVTSSSIAVRPGRAENTGQMIDGQNVGDLITAGGSGLGKAADIAGARYAPTPSIFATEDVQVSTGDFGAGYGNATNGYINTTARTPVQQDNTIVTENYAPLIENDYHAVANEALSTFSIDVDNASYANARRYLNGNMMPPKDAVRIEEFINYFPYHHKEPKGNLPFSINTELTTCPWNEKHKLIMIGLKAKELALEEAPASNLVFLIDVSGSMSDKNKLPLVKQSLALLVDNLRSKDKISIVVYAGAAGLVLPPTSGADKKTIKAALERLNAGGSTAGGAGIELAYKTAKENFMKDGTNRVILATDGDFNVGVSSDGELVRLIEEKRKDKIFLTVLGFGMGNYKDSKMEQLADKGNGNYAYIDNIKEAQKQLVHQMSGTLFTVAKDVKIQVEFNPAYVKSYRLIGYENRMLNKEDFNDDSKDAGEIGAGHTVTAFYEIVPLSEESETTRDVDALKYQTLIPVESGASNEVMTVKLRYKEPDGDVSKLIEQPVEINSDEFSSASENMRFAASVVEFAMLLRDSKYKGSASFESIQQNAKTAIGKDKEGYRAEFLQLVEKAKTLSATAQK